MAKPPCIRCDCRFQRRFGWLVFTQATRSFRTRMIGAEGRHASHNRSALGSGGEIVLGHARLAAGGQGQAGLVQRTEMLVIDLAIQQIAAQPHRISRACMVGVDIATPAITAAPTVQVARPFAADSQGQAGLVQCVEGQVIDLAIQQIAAQPHRISRACMVGVDIATPTISPRPSAQAARPFSATPSSRQTARVRSGLFSV